MRRLRLQPHVKSNRSMHFYTVDEEEEKEKWRTRWSRSPLQLSAACTVLINEQEESRDDDNDDCRRKNDS